jgi:transposase
MAKDQRKRKKRSERGESALPRNTARSARGTLRSSTVGALPILNRVLKRMRLEEHLQAYLPDEDGRTRPSTPKALVVLVQNLLLSREPLYGIGEWATGYAAHLLGIAAAEVARLNDDRMGRALDRLFLADVPSLALAVAAQVVREFDVSVDELHNDSTTITFAGAYAQADGRRFLGQPTLSITWGHNKDHRPDLKQLLFILTVAEDGGVPLHFRAADGNTPDVSTHRDTWELLCRLAGRNDFLYVADCKLASSGNMNYIAENHGKFLTLLPRGRREDTAFRQQLREKPVTWEHLLDKTDECGQLVDRYSVCTQPAITAEGYRLVWYHSTLKAEQDAAWRSRQIQRTLKRLEELRRKLLLPKTRYRQATKVRKAVAAILKELDTEEWVRFQVMPKVTTTYHAEKPGRPKATTRFLRRYRTRFDLHYEVDVARVAESGTGDGVFPLVTNVAELSPGELLAAYKRQPVIEKRFSQLKTDFSVAPVYLKEARRIQALLCAYFFALMAEALVERELRRAMQREGIESLPMYPEGRPCHRPTTRRLIDLFAAVQRHEFVGRKGLPQVMITELTGLQRRLLRLLGVSDTDYGR